METTKTNAPKATRYKAGDRATIIPSAREKREGVKMAEVTVLDPNYGNKGSVQVEYPDGKIGVVAHWQLTPVDKTVERANVPAAPVPARDPEPIGRAAEIARGGK